MRTVVLLALMLHVCTRCAVCVTPPPSPECEFDHNAVSNNLIQHATGPTHYQSVFAIDYDADGTDDVVVLSAALGHSVLVSDGVGGFAASAPAAGLPAGDVDGVALADFNQDGFTDVAMRVAAYPGDVLVSLHNGVSALGAATSVFGGLMLSVSNVAVGDGDGDTDADVVFRASSTVYWVENTGVGSGSFAAPVLVSGTPASLTFGLRLDDLDGDGIGDLLLLNSGGLSAMWGSATGVFGAPLVVAPTVSILREPVVADFDHDGDADIVIGETGFVLYFKCAGTRAACVLVDQLSTTISSALAVVGADVNADSWLDVVVYPFSSGKVFVFLNVHGQPSPSASGFSYPMIVSDTEFAVSRSLALGDYDDDGRPDMVLLYFKSSNEWIDVVWSYAPPLGWGARATVAAGDGIVSLAWADLDGDSDLDMAYVAAVGDTYHVALNSGSGTFTHTAFSSVGDFGSTVSAADINGDAIVDLAFGASNNDRVSVFFGVGDGTFPTEVVVTTACNNPADLDVADLDGDGDLDLALACKQGANTAWARNDGAGTAWTYIGLHSSLGLLSTIVARDFDLDGDIDIVVGRSGDSLLSSWLNAGDGTFASRADYACATPSAMDAGLVNADAAPDVLAGCASSQTVVLLVNNHPAAGFAAPAVVSSSVGSQLVDVKLIDLTGDGVLDAVFADTTSASVRYRAGDGLGSFGSVVTVATDVGGVKAVVAFDADGDGDVDVHAGSYHDTVYQYKALSRGPYDLLAPVTRPFVSPDTAHVCRTSPASLVCFFHQAQYASRCVRDTVLVPPRTFAGGFTKSYFPLDHDVTFVSSSPDAPFAFDADASAPTGVLFETSGGAAVTFDNVRFTGMGPGAFAAAAQGLRVTDPSTVLVLRNATITASSAVPVSGVVLTHNGFGGAVLAENGARLALVDSHVSGCSAALLGGALYATGAGSTVTITSSTVAGCSAPSGGAVAASVDASVRVSSSVISASTATFSGGALYVQTGASATVTDGTLITSSQASFSGGGGVYVATGSAFTLTNATIEHNLSGLGGGGGVLAEVGAAAELGSGAVVRTNTARFGGGIAVLPDVSILLASAMASSIEAPRATDASAMGALSGVLPTVVVANAVVTGNVAHTYGGGLYVCQAKVEVSGTPELHSNVAGEGQVGPSGDVFFCGLATGVSEPSPAPTRALLPWIRTNSSAAAAVLANAAVHGPVVQLEWATLPPASVQSGSVVPATVVAADVLGTKIADPTLSLTVSVAAAGDGGGVASGVFSALLSGGHASDSTSLPDIAVYKGGATSTATVSELVLVAAIEGASPVMATAAARVEVGGCAEGSGSVATTVLSEGAPVPVVTCVPCGAGTFSAVVAFEPCEVVLPCTENSFDVSPANATVLECVCKAGFTLSERLDDERVSCVACPPGGVCAEGLGPPVPLPGFFASDVGFLRCVRPKSCPGGGTVCSPGYTGYLCASCASGWYTTEDGKCAECPNGASPTFYLAVAVASLVVIGLSVFVALGLSKQDGQVGVGKDNGLRRRKVPSSISLVIVTFQLVGVVGRARLSWPSSVSDALAYFSLASFDMSAVASECVLGSFHSQFMFSILVPSGLVLAVALVVVVVRLFLPVLRRTSASVVFNHVLFSLGPLVYVPIADATLVLFDCVQLPNGKFVVDADPGVECFDSAWMGVLPYAVVIGALFVVGLPTYFLAVLHTNRQTLFTPVTFKRYGALYRLYRRPVYFAGIIDLLVRLAIVAITLFLSDSPLVLVGSLTFVIVVMLVTVHRVEVYYFPHLNRVVFVLATMLLTVVLLGGAAYAERGTGSEDGLTAAAFFVVVALVVAAVWAIGIDVYQVYFVPASAIAAAREAAFTAWVASRTLDLDRNNEAPGASDVELADARTWSESSDSDNSSALTPLSSAGVGLPDAAPAAHLSE